MGTNAMKAVRIHALGKPPDGVLEDVLDPEPGPEDVIIDIAAAPVNYVDILTSSGQYQFTPQLPYIPGKGPAGTISEAGADVPLRPGDRVLGMAEYGGYAERVRVHRSQCYVLPDSLSFVDAAAMSLAFDTAWMALSERARLAQGESVLVLGATGAVGSAAVQLARAMGARRILGAGTSPDRLEAEGRVDDVVDLGGEDLRESVYKQVMAATGRRGVDVIIDPVGGDAFDGAIRSLAWRGRLVIVGFAAGRIPNLKMNYPLLKNIEISGLQISDYRKRMPDLMARCFRDIFHFHEQGMITAPASITFPLNEWQDAMAMVDDRTTRHRVLLTPG